MFHPLRLLNARSVRFAALLLITIAAGHPCSVLAQDPAELVEKGKTLLKEGDRLADDGKPNEAVILYQQAFEKLLPGLRKLPFKSEVKRDITAREDLQASLIKEIDEEITPEEFKTNELGLKAIGFLPRTFDLKSAWVKVYSEEIAAYYDPSTKTMHLIKEPDPATVKPKKKGLLDWLLGKKEGFDKSENKTVIAHELTHALADQHFDIHALQDEIVGNDDRDLALSALIEGEATLAMTGAQMEDWDGSQSSQLPYDVLGKSLKWLGPFMALGSGQAFREAPAILSASMLFPYMQGMVFVAKLTNEKGWEGVTKAYGAPPLSTEQILHPEKYGDKPDNPTYVDLGTLDPGDGWKEIGRNVIGEMQLGILLKATGVANPGAGWDGDRFAVFENDKPDGPVGLVWETTWDSDADAKKFMIGYAKFLKTKLDNLNVAFDDDLVTIRIEKEQVTYAIERKGPDVAIVEGFPRAVADRLIESALKAKKTEITYENVRELEAVAKKK